MKTIVETAVETRSLETLSIGLRGAFLVRRLLGSGPYTVFAPTNDAFAAMPAGVFDWLFEDRARLAHVLAYHIVPGKVMAHDMTSLHSLPTVQGNALRIATFDGQVTVNDAHVISSDVFCSNGIIHLIDAVLEPDIAEAVA